MKNNCVMLLIVLCFIIPQVGCQKSNTDSEICPVAVTVNGQNLVLHEIDASA